jgi:hypothetical protein
LEWDTHPFATRDLLQRLAHFRRRYLFLPPALPLPRSCRRLGHLHVFILIFVQLLSTGASPLSPLIAFALAPVRTISSIVAFAFTAIPTRLWLRVQFLIPIQMRKFIYVIGERRMVGSMERCRRRVTRERVKCVTRNATLLRETLPKCASFFIVLILVRLIGA